MFLELQNEAVVKALSFFTGYGIGCVIKANRIELP